MKLTEEEKAFVQRMPTEREFNPTVYRKDGTSRQITVRYIREDLVPRWKTLAEETPREGEEVVLSPTGIIGERMQTAIYAPKLHKGDYWLIGRRFYPTADTDKWIPIQKTEL